LRVVQAGENGGGVAHRGAHHTGQGRDWHALKGAKDAPVRAVICGARATIPGSATAASFRELSVKYRPLLAVLLIATFARAAFADTESELRAIEETRRAAIKARDFGVLEKIYSPGFIAVGGNGQFVDREGLFRLFGQADASLVFTTDEIRVVGDGDTAVFFGRLKASTADGNTLYVSRFSHVFVRRNGQWTCIAGQSTPQPG
jgi:ketosteroid isomerase-like protein